MTRPTLGLLLLGTILPSTGCTVWRVQSATTPQLLEKKPLQTIRIVTVDSIPVVLHQPRIVGDSVTGHPSPNAVEKRTINLKDISTVATKSINIGKTFFAGLTIAGGLIVYSLLQGLNGTSP